MTATPPRALALGTAAAILSFIGGMLVMYYTQESRIERMDKLDSLEWDNNGRAQADIKDTQTALHALTEKILKLEFNPASRISKPETP